jgi:hypothetical protein
VARWTARTPSTAASITSARSARVAPGLFAQEGRCWRMVYENVAGHGGHCGEPVAWVGRWKFLDGWTKVWSCERHADELTGARRLPTT